MKILCKHCPEGEDVTPSRKFQIEFDAENIQLIFTCEQGHKNIFNGIIFENIMKSLGYLRGVDHPRTHKPITQESNGVKVEDHRELETKLNTNRKSEDHDGDEMPDNEVIEEHQLPILVEFYVTEWLVDKKMGEGTMGEVKELQGEEKEWPDERNKDGYNMYLKFTGIMKKDTGKALLIGEAWWALSQVVGLRYLGSPSEVSDTLASMEAKDEEFNQELEDDEVPF